MRAGASTESLRAPLTEPAADTPARALDDFASDDDDDDNVPSTSERTSPVSHSGGFRGILSALRDPVSGP
jgi:hypothetical protein